MLFKNWDRSSGRSSERRNGNGITGANDTGARKGVQGAKSAKKEEVKKNGTNPKKGINE